MELTTIQKILNIVLFIIEVFFAVIMVVMMFEGSSGAGLAFFVLVCLIAGMVLKAIDLKQLYEIAPLRRRKRPSPKSGRRFTSAQASRLDRQRQRTDQALADSLRKSREEQIEEIDPEELQDMLSGPDQGSESKDRTASH